MDMAHCAQSAEERAQEAGRRGAGVDYEKPLRLREPLRQRPPPRRWRSRSLWREDGGVLYVVKDAEAQRRLAKKPAIGRASPGAQALP